MAIVSLSLWVSGPAFLSPWLWVSNFLCLCLSHSVPIFSLLDSKCNSMVLVSFLIRQCFSGIVTVVSLSWPLHLLVSLVSLFCGSSTCVSSFSLFFFSSPSWALVYSWSLWHCLPPPWHLCLPGSQCFHPLAPFYFLIALRNHVFPTLTCYWTGQGSLWEQALPHSWLYPQHLEQCLAHEGEGQ